MAALQDWVAVGAPSRAPGSPIQLVRNPTGVLHVALSFREELRDHPMLHDGMAEVSQFAQAPGVTGIAPLVQWERTTATFVYPMAHGVLLSDLVHARRFHRGPHPPRAALQLLFELGAILHEAGPRAASAGLTSHGAIDPWRIVLHGNASTTLIGYGLPAVDVMAWLDEETDRHPGAALRYFPPERVEDSSEDVRSDIYSVALCAAELLFGRPLLEGDARQVVDAILDGEVARRITAATDIAPDVQRLLAACVAPRADDRIASGEQLAREAKALLDSCEGPTLHELAKPLADTGGPAPFDDFDADEAKTEIIEPRTDRPTPPRPAIAEPPVVEEADENADLPELRNEGDLIVKRAYEIAEQASGLAAQVADLATQAPLEVAFLRRAYDGAQRAQRAADSSAQAAALLAQDVDSAAARITLDLVRAAETQASQANQDVAKQLQAIEHHQEKESARAKALADTRRRAADHASAAAESAAQSDELVTDLEKAQLTGALSARGCAVAVDHASATAELAHAQAEDARHHAEQAENAASVELALRHAEAAARAEERARSHLDDTQRAAEHARRLEAQAKAAAISNARAASTAARLAYGQAERSLARAEELIAKFPEGASAAAASFEACRKGVRASDVAATLTAQVALEAEEQEGSSAAQAKAELAAAAVERTRAEVAKAVDAADQVRAAVGAAGHVHAELSAVIEQAEALLAQAKLAVTRVDEEMDGLLGQTGTLDGAQVVEQRAVAQRETERAKERLPEIERAVRAVRVALAAETALRRFPELRAAVDALLADAGKAHDAIAETWEAAEIELVEVRRREAAQRGIAAAGDAADAHAAAAVQLVAEAREAAQRAEAALADCRQEDALRLRQRAVEIISLAEFQAGEASSAAREARQETEPTEARAHAQTALSFFERISADLPDALSALEQAEQLAETESTTMARAKEETAATRALVSHLATTARRAAEQGRADVASWEELPEVQQGLRDLAGTIASFDEDEAEVAWAHQQVPTLDGLTQATAVLTKVENVAARARDRRRQVDVVLEQMSRAIADAMADQRAKEEARNTVANAIDAVLANLGRVQEASGRLDREVQTHEARGDAAVDAIQAMHDAIRQVEHAAAALSGLAGRVARAESGAYAVTLAEEAGRHRSTAEQAVEASAEAETRGTAAAEAEARARAAEIERRLQHARDEAVRIQQRLDEVLQRVEDAFRRAGTEGLDELAESQLRKGAARERLTEAKELQAALDVYRDELAMHVVRAASEADPDQAEVHVNKARAALDGGNTLVPRIESTLTAAIDLARTALVEVEAMREVRNEIEALIEPARDSVARAHAGGERVLGILHEAEATRPDDADAAPAQALEAKVHHALEAARTAAAEVQDAIPRARQADNLASTQAILDGVRAATSRAAASADEVVALVDDANEQLLTAQLSLAHALDQAQGAVSKPAQDAAAAAKKAEAWLEAGRREAREAGLEEQLEYELSALARAVRTVSRHAGQAERAADRARESEDPRAVHQALGTVRTAADQASTSAEEARRALEIVRERVTASSAVNEAISSQIQEAAESRALISQLADQAEATVQAIESRIAKLVSAPREIRAILEEARSASAQVRLAAGRATSSVSKARAARTQAASSAGQQEVAAALAEARESVELVQGAERRVLQAIERAREQAGRARSEADGARRRQADDTNRKARAARREREIAARAALEQQARQRRVRVDRRREERSRRGNDDPPTTSTMRALLGADRKPPRKGPRSSLYAEPSDKSIIPMEDDGGLTEEGAPPVRASGRAYQPSLQVEVIRGNHTGELPRRPRAPPSEGLFSARQGADPRKTLPPIAPRTIKPGATVEPREEPVDSSDVDSLLKRLRQRRR